MSSSVRLPKFRKSDRSVRVFRVFRVFRGSVVPWFRGSVVPWLLDRRLALQPYQVTDFNSSMVLV